MKFVKKIPPMDYKLSEELVAAGWRKIKEPKNLLTTIYSEYTIYDYKWYTRYICYYSILQSYRKYSW